MQELYGSLLTFDGLQLSVGEDVSALRSAELEVDAVPTVEVGQAVRRDDYSKLVKENLTALLETEEGHGLQGLLTDDAFEDVGRELSGPAYLGVARADAVADVVLAGAPHTRLRDVELSGDATVCSSGNKRISAQL